MRVRCLSWMIVTVVTCLLVTGCEPKTIQTSSVDEEPLLLIEDNASLIPASELAVDNSRCHVCHINYSFEKLAVDHAKAGVGCEQCHGSSDAHCSDEDNVTPPDVIFAEEKIQPFCMDCHVKEKIDIKPHRIFLGKADGAKNYCTKCHGDHRLIVRTRRWDKRTRELIQDDKVRMTTDEPFEEM